MNTAHCWQLLPHGSSRKSDCTISSSVYEQQHECLSTATEAIYFIDAKP
jgi:hypothetical protein